MEFIGTFFLIFTIALTSTKGYDNPVPPLAIGSVLIVLVYMAGPISGAHFNPAVSIGIFLSRRNKITFRKLIGYILTQVVAGFVAGGLVAGLSEMSHIGPPELDTTYKFIVAFVVESLFSFLLMSVVLHVATTRVAAENKPFIGIAIGLTVMVGALSVSHMSGAVFNPAVGTGPFIVGFFMPNSTINMTGAQLAESILILYWLGPILGCVLASLLFRLTMSDEYVSTSFEM